MRPIRILSLLSLLVIFSGKIFGQLIVDNDVTPQEALDVLLGNSGIDAFNVTFSGDANQLGTFNANGSNVPIAEGIIIGTGNVALASNEGAGGNNAGGGSLDGGNNDVDDVDLEYIATLASPDGLDIPINDAAFLEFDFISPSDSVEFKYVFASEEYPEFVCGTVNDAFGFFISGPGLDGGNLFENNAINVAVIPNTDPVEYVSINSVNDGATPPCEGNTQFYAGNNPISNDVNSIEYDGWTVVLTASAQLECNQQYHIKMAIGDGGDTVWDSAVFLEAGSFQATGANFNIGAPLADGLFGDQLIFEGGCNDGEVSINFTSCSTVNVDTIFPFIGGDAVIGQDYFIQFPGNDTLYSELDFILIDDDGTAFFNIIVPDEMEVEPQETITFNFPIPDADDPTINQDTLVGSLFIQDYAEPIIANLVDSVYLCAGVEYDINFDVIDGQAPFAYEWSDEQLEDDMNTITTPGGTTTYYITVTDVCNESSMDSIIVGIPPTFTPLMSTVQLCPDATSDSLFIGGEPPYMYEFSGALDETIDNVNSGEFSALIGGEYDLTITDDCDVELDYSILIYNYASIIATAPTDGGFAIYGDSILLEGCNEGMFDIDVVTECIALPGNVLPYTLTGEATQNVDYTGVPNQLELPADGNLSIPITTTQDGEIEGDELLIFNIQYQNPVTGLQETLSDTLYIRDYLPIDISLPEDQMICANTDFFPQVSIENGALPFQYAWSPEEIMSDATAAAPFFASQDITYSATITDVCSNSDTDEQFVFLPEELLLADTLTYCIGSLSDPVISGGMLPYNYGALDPRYLIENPINGAFTAEEQVPCGIPYVITDACDVSPTFGEIYPLYQCESVFFNVFTPDGDTDCPETLAYDRLCDGVAAPPGCNNVFYIEGNVLFPGSELYVYNRWGTLVWDSEGKGYQNNWDGTTKAGDELVTGTYFYVYQRSDGKNFEGNVSILR